MGIAGAAVVGIEDAGTNPSGAGGTRTVSETQRT